MSTINLDPPEEFLEARQLGALIERWLASKAGKAPATLLGYRNKIKCFTIWWDVEGPAHDWRLTKSSLQQFEIYLCGVKTKWSKTPLAYSNRHAIIRTLRMMFKWAFDTERTIRNYGKWVPWPTGKTPQRKSATVEQLKRLMLSAAQSETPLRDQAIIAFFIGTGCRLCEVTTLRVDDLQILEDGSGTATVTGKRSKANESGVHPVAFDSATGAYLKRYIANTEIVSDCLWRSRVPTRNLLTPAVAAIVKRAVNRAGLGNNIRGCHDLRRAFATILGLLYPNSPAWADMIRRQLGHKHYSQTAAYTLIEVDDIRERIITPLSVKQSSNKI